MAGVPPLLESVELAEVTGALRDMVRRKTLAERIYTKTHGNDWTGEKRTRRGGGTAVVNMVGNNELAGNSV